MRRRSARGRLWFSAIWIACGMRASADAPHIPVFEDQTPARMLTLDSIAALPPPLWPQPWHLYAVPSIQVDNNINHLLINTTVNSNTRVSDTIIRTQAGASYHPNWSDHWSPFFAYDFQRFDYVENSGFSFYQHDIYGELDYWFNKRWAFDSGVDSTWYADDETGLVTDDQTGHIGFRWHVRRSRLRAGYAFRRSGFIFTPGKSAYANSGYVEIVRGFFRRQAGYLYYDYRRSRADDAIYSFQSHYVEGGWINPWTKRLRVSWLASFLDKPYAHFDERFLAQRADRTYSLEAKPSFAFYPSLRLIASYTYSWNESNVEIRRYVDQLYAISLEARF